jgi:hypothetical protein
MFELCCTLPLVLLWDVVIAMSIMDGWMVWLALPPAAHASVPEGTAVMTT